MPTAAEKSFFSSSKQYAIMHKTQLFISSKEMSTSKLINIKVAQQRTTSHRYAFERTYLMISYSIGTSSKLMLWIPSYAGNRFGSFTIRNSLRSASSKNSGLKWHVIKYGLDRIGNTWTVSCDVMLGLRRMSKWSFTGLVVKKVSLRWDACLCIFRESRWSLLNEVIIDWIGKTWINKTWSDKTWINKTLLLERTLRPQGCKLRMRRNSKKLYFSGYPSIQIPLLFWIPFDTNNFAFLLLCNRRLNFFIGSLLRWCMTVAVSEYDYNFCHK